VEGGRRGTVRPRAPIVAKLPRRTPSGLARPPILTESEHHGRPRTTARTPAHAIETEKSRN